MSVMVRISPSYARTVECDKEIKRNRKVTYREKEGQQKEIEKKNDGNGSNGSNVSNDSGLPAGNTPAGEHRRVPAGGTNEV